MEKAIPGLISAIPDLVRDWELQTTVGDTCTVETSYVSDASKGVWRKRVKECWEHKEELGSGTFGVVSLQKCASGPRNGSVRAVKRIHMRTGLSAAEVNVLSRELSATVKFSHEQYRDCFVRSFGWFYANNALFITMEYCPLGDLQSYIEKPLPEEETRRISQQILQGLEFMHRNNYAHRDLKPSNILVQHKGPNWWVKLSDFGTSKQIGTTLLRTETGTRPYLAPEVQNIFSPADLEVIESDTYSIAVDIWSVGVIIFRITMGRLPFELTTSLYRYVLLSEPLPKTDSLTAECRDLMASMMKGSPRQRPTAVEALASLWINMPSPVTNLKADVLVQNDSSIYSNQWSTIGNKSEEPASFRTNPASASVLLDQASHSLFPDDDPTITLPQHEVEKAFTPETSRIPVRGGFIKIQQVDDDYLADVVSLAISPDGKWLAVVARRSLDGGVWVWNFTKPVDFRNPRKLSDPDFGSHVFFTSDSRELTVIDDGIPTSYLVDPHGWIMHTADHDYVQKKMKTTKSRDMDNNGTSNATYVVQTLSSSNCELFINKTRNNATRIYEARVWKRTPATRSGKQFAEVQTRRQYERGVLETPQFSCSSDGQTYIEFPWNQRPSPFSLWKFGGDGKFHHVFETSLPIGIHRPIAGSCAEISPNARWVVYWTIEFGNDGLGRTHIFELEQNGIRGQGISLGNESTVSAAFSPNSKLVAIVLRDGDIVIWKLNDEDVFVQEQRMKGGKTTESYRPCPLLSFSSDNKFLVVVFHYRVLQIWEMTQA